VSSNLDAMCCANFGIFHGRKFRKIPNKAIKTVKSIFVWAFIIEDYNPKPMVMKQYFIIAYCM